VPDLEVIAKAYLAGVDWPIQGYLMGGQVDERDFHKSAFDAEALEEVLRAVGLVGIHRWKSELSDCADLQVSLNLAGYKRQPWPKTSAVMSVPRLGFMDNFFSAFEALMPLKIPLRKTSGAFWGQCLTRAIEDAIRETDPVYILTVDYDTIYRKTDIEDLLALAIAHSADAIAPVQAARSVNAPLFFIRGSNGEGRGQIARDEMAAPILPVDSAHFGCTLIRADKLATLPRPWLWSTPDPEGGWDKGRVDDDIYFWHRWTEAGNTLYVAPRVVVGHAELMIRWPDENMRPIHQHPSDYHRDGKPTEVWR
jgi:hypothetical protein